jgi:hypothetical protein
MRCSHVLVVLGALGSLGLVGAAGAGSIAQARADDVVAYDADGEADAAGADPRVAALDAAFAQAVTQAVSDLLDADVRKRHRAAITEHIVGRARLWVARFSVRRDDTADGRRQLAVTVRVDRDKLRARLAELGIAAEGSGAAAAEGDGARAAVILLRVTEPRGVRASFGASAEREPPGYGALAAAVRAAGYAIQRAPAAGPAARSDGELPLDDAAAGALAASARAELAAIAGVAVGDPVAVRGQPTIAVLVSARVRAIAGDQLAGQGAGAIAARGSEGAAVTAAIDRALGAAAAEAFPAVGARLARAAASAPRDDAPVAEPGVVLVRVAPRTPWGLVAAQIKWLAGAKGVRRAVLRRLSPGGWVIGVTTAEPIERIAQIARKAPAPDASVKVRIADGIVEIALAGTP